MMSQARSPVVTASGVIAAFLALTRPAAHARTTMPASASPSTSMIEQDRPTPGQVHRGNQYARRAVSETDEKFDTTQNNDDFAHRSSSDSRNAAACRRRPRPGR